MEKSYLIKSIEEWREYYLSVLTTSLSREVSLILPSKEMALALIGIRRSGKTTLAIQLSEKIDADKVFYYNFEDPLFASTATTKDLDLLMEAAEEFSEQKIELIILDEIHNINQWEKWLRKLIDHKQYRIIITGSSAKLLTSELSTALTGRAISKEIWPLSVVEYYNFNKILKTEKSPLKTIKDYLTFGGFPTVVKEKNKLQKKEILRSYFTDILFKDVVTRNKIRNVKGLQDLATYVITNLSSLHSSNSIEKALGLDKETAQAYLSYLEDSFLINSCEMYTNNLKVQQRAATKYYLTDLGLRLVGARSNSNDEGKLLENLVYLELRRKNPDIYYFKGLKEVDFLLCDKYQPKVAYQVCYSLMEPDTREREIAGLLEISKVYDLSNLYIVTWNERDIIKTDKRKINVIPVSELSGLNIVSAF
jgi:predicted AAA+ superfamily ATPase